MSALPMRVTVPQSVATRDAIPFWPGPKSKLQAREALKLEQTPGCGRLDRSDFAMWTPEGRDALARILRNVIERNERPR